MASLQPTPAFLDVTPPGQQLKEGLKDLKKLYFTIENSLNKFDAALEDESQAAEDLIDRPNYLDLQALRDVRDKKIENMVDAYLVLAMDPAPAARTILAEFFTDLQGNGDVERLAYLDLVEALSPYAELSDLKFRSEAEVEEATLRARSDHSISLANLGYLTGELGEMFQDSREAVKSAAVEIADSRYTPSSGKSGNINGSGFRSGTWAVTFDDGPHNSFTAKVVAASRSGGVPVTFFWLAKNVKNLVSIGKSVVSAGIPVGDHSYTHPTLTKLSSANLDYQVSSSKKVFVDKLGVTPKFFRAPYGAVNAKVRQAIARANMIHVGWNVDSLDWQDKSPDSILRRVKKQMKGAGHGVILFHDIHPQSVSAFKLLIKDKAGSGINWITLPQAL